MSKNQEFRNYRRGLVWGYLTVVSAGALLLIVSVGVGLFFPRGAQAQAGSPSAVEQYDCLQRLQRSLDQLEILPSETLRRAAGVGSEVGREIARDAVANWKREWLDTGHRCQLDPDPGRVITPTDNRLGSVYSDLFERHLEVDAMLARYVAEQAPAFDDLHRALRREQRRIDRLLKKAPSRTLD